MLLIYAVTLFVSALLVFLVQPMVGKMILPALGGTPAVWNTCMVFFQAALLAGYAYAHASVRLLGVRKQAGLHLAILLAPVAVLPVAVSMSGVPSSADNPMFWLLGRLVVGVGLPFFVVSTTAPLLPQSAVLSDEQGNYVYIINGKNEVERRNVKIGTVDDRGVTVTQGITGQEAVVLSAGPFLNPGQKVRSKRQAAR